MKTLNIAFTAILMTAGLSSAAFAHPAHFGSVAAPAGTDREIVLTPGAHYANVNNGETVTFVADGKRFTWHFDTLPTSTSLDLSAIAPQDFASGGVRVYVASNPLYRG